MYATHGLIRVKRVAKVDDDAAGVRVALGVVVRRHVVLRTRATLLHRHLNGVELGPRLEYTDRVGGCVTGHLTESTQRIVLITSTLTTICMYNNKIERYANTYKL